jgi:hypothetical protein
MNANAAASEMAFPHVHGLTYDGAGKRLYVAVHDGLIVYRGGRWARGPEPRHDFMGFSGTRKFFFSSGHPAPGSDLVNPLGLMQSADGAKTWTKRGLLGESDFHLLAAGFEDDAIYVYSPEPNSKMKSPGFYYSVNQGFTWQAAAAAGLRGQPIALAVHPTDPAIVAVGTRSGVFLSRDHGARFEPLETDRKGLALRFDLDAKSLWIGSYEGAPSLQRVSFDGPRRETVALPAIGQDAVAYIAQNPARRDEVAIATFERSIYLSEDRGRHWKQIAGNGKTK